MGNCIIDNKAIVTRYLEEIVNRGSFQVADEILAEDFVNHTAGGGIGTGRGGFVRSLEALRTAFPDWRVSVQAMIAEGDFVSDHLSVSATHTGKAAGSEPTGEKISGELIHLWRVLNGRLAEGWYFGTPELMRRVFAAVSAT